ncbi:hypothetical protein ES705_12657 [subsurface metagenome]
MISLYHQFSIGGSGDDRAHSIIETSVGDLVIAGRTLSSDGDVSVNNGSGDYWVVKSKVNGDIQWQKSFGGSGYDWASSIIQTSDGGYAIAGTSESDDGDVSGNMGGQDCWIVKLTASGIIEWQKPLGGSADERANSIIQTTDGGYAFVGFTNSNDGIVSLNHGRSDIWLVKLDKNGNIEWQKSLGGSDYDYGLDIIQTSDGGYAIAGHSKSNDGNLSVNYGFHDYWILKLDSQGVIEWQQSYGGSQTEECNSIIQTSDGGYALAGYTLSSDGNVSLNHGFEDFWVVKLNSHGAIDWQKSLGGSENDRAFSIIQTSDDGFAIAGRSHSNDSDVSGNHGEYDYWVVKLSFNGAIEWQKSSGGSRSDHAYSIIQTSNGKYAIAGMSKSDNGEVSSNLGTFDWWIVILE